MGRGMMDMHFIMLHRLRVAVLEELRLRAINAAYSESAVKGDRFVSRSIRASAHKFP